MHRSFLPSFQPIFQVEDKVVTILETVGQGAFGVVYRVTDQAGRVYALKVVDCLNASEIDNAIREAQILKQLSHENVIAMIAAGQMTNNQGWRILILTEYCGGGSLNARLGRPSSEETNFKWILQIGEALAYLHSQQIVHRDLKGDNVLLNATEDAKLADFGLAREYIALKRIREHGVEGWWTTCYIQYYMNSVVGSPPWMAPEVFDGRYTEKSDIFSFGTLVFAILERDFVMSNTNKPYFGAFKSIPGVGKVGIGHAMAYYFQANGNPDITVQFSPGAQGSSALQKIALDAMKYYQYFRPSAVEIRDRLRSIQESVRLHTSQNSQNYNYCQN